MVLGLLLNQREWEKAQVKELEEEVRRVGLCRSFLRAGMAAGTPAAG